MFNSSSGESSLRITKREKGPLKKISASVNSFNAREREREREMQEQNLVRQAEWWRQHSASIAEVAQGTIRDTEEELTAERLNAEELRLELQEEQDQLTTRQEWYDQYDWGEEEEQDLYGDGEGSSSSTPRMRRDNSNHSGWTTSNTSGVDGTDPCSPHASDNSS